MSNTDFMSLKVKTLFLISPTEINMNQKQIENLDEWVKTYESHEIEFLISCNRYPSTIKNKLEKFNIKYFTKKKISES
jgi:predicted HAD superfamily phosphohydrolase YqeG